MKLRPALVGLTACALLAPAVAQASTAAERESWAKTTPRVLSHGVESDDVCLDRAEWRNEDGGFSRESFVCNQQFSGIPVHEGGKIVVVTPRQATAVGIGLSFNPSENDGDRGLKSCRRVEPGRWRCRMPAPASREGGLRLKVKYPGARTFASFEYVAHSPDRH